MPVPWSIVVNGVDRTSDLMRLKIRNSVSADLPSCDILLSNQSAAYTSVPLYSNVQVTLPSGIGTFNFYCEEQDYQSDANQGSVAEFFGVSAPELLNLSEGNLDVVGADQNVGAFQTRIGYIPYASQFVSTLGTNLMDINTILTTLLHTAQPKQTAGYQGRLGYDATGLGMKTGVDCDYTQGSIPTGPFYVKGQWKVGLGSTGGQKTGLDMIKDLCSKNVIDGTGTPNILDFYVDPTQTPPQLVVFPRGYYSSGTTFVKGVDGITRLKLPVDTKDIKNFVVFWANNELTYPNSGDAWSNYSSSAQLQSQWSNSNGAITLTVDSNPANTATGFGTSNKYTNTDSVNNQTTTSVFNLGGRYALLQPARNLTAFNFWIKGIPIQGPGLPLTIILTDTNGGTATSQSSPTLWNTSTNSARISKPIPDPTTGFNWWNLLFRGVLFTVPAPPNVSDSTPWTFAGGFDFSLSTISSITLQFTLGPSTTWWIDTINFSESWGYSPTYSYNWSGAGVTTLFSAATAGQSSVVGLSTAGFVVGQYVTICDANFDNIDFRQITSVLNFSLGLSSPLSFNHAIGEYVIGGTHDPNSMAQYKTRIFNYSDFYVSDAGGDSAPSIANAILQMRKGKLSSGEIEVSGYNQGIAAIKPGYRFHIVSQKDTYLGGGVDSTIDSWIAQSVEYNIDPTNGFRVLYNVEPWYSTFAASSPDSNFPKKFAASFGGGNVLTNHLAKIYRNSQTFGGQP